MRWYAHTPRGENYQTIVAHGGEGDHAMPGLADRLIGDLLSPVRSGSVIEGVTAIRRDGMDPMDWSVAEVLAMVRSIEQTRQAEG